jgi:Asp-tRNA(Asn)/Glu-tRNA(Gln) amidotransferase A subunit family amidase
MNALATLTDWLQAPAAERERGVHSAIARIRELDASIQAWACVDPQAPTGGGPLSGIPFAAKDIFETKGMPTEYGSPIYQGRIGSEDAALVRRLRDYGAVLLGKTHTAAFAHRTPPPTRNPRNLEHTPGGSSSGSAAAVAANMVPIALGTQTKGSVLRPASYCGVTGFKPTYGLLPMEGILPLSVSLDTPGFFTHTPADMLAVWEVMCPASDDRQPPSPVFGVPTPLPDVEPVMAQAFHDAVSALRAAGATIRPVDIAAMLRTLCEANDTVMYFEGARFHRERYDLYGDRLDDLVTLVRRGLLVSTQKYEAAKKVIESCRAKIAGIFADTPVVLLPAATGPAPRGLASTGDARMNAPWTTLGTPAISIPLPTGDAMPLGLQLTAPRGEDAMLLRAAAGAHAMLGAAIA